jgi:hypothetical protein
MKFWALDALRDTFERPAGDIFFARPQLRVG